MLRWANLLHFPLSFLPRSPAVHPHLAPCFLLLLLAASAGAQEIRALWADAFHAGLRNSTETAALIAAARTANCNAVFVQVRKRGDAYYRGGLEPTAIDVAAGFDPLADLIQRGHTGSPRIEVHAWIVSYNIWNQQLSPPSQPTHPYNLHPDWLCQNNTGAQWDGGNYQLDPGHPAVQQHTYNVAMDLVSRYDIDGLHFDYIRYSDSGSSGGNQPWGYNPVTVARYQALTGTSTIPAPTNAAWLQWRRDQVTALVRKVYLNAWAAKPQVRISAALICYDPAPVLTMSSWLSSAAYSRVLQDWRGWLEEGILDLGCPMVYKTSNTSVTNWTSFIRDRQYGRASAIGLGWYLNPIATTNTQIGIARTASAGGKSVAGLLGYSYAVPDSTGATQSTMWSNLTAGPYPTAVNPSPMPWKTSTTAGHVMGRILAGDTGTAFDGATVTLAGPVNRTLTTDATGFFGAVDLPIGTYTASITRPGFAPLTRTFSVTGGNVAQPAMTLTLIPFVVTSTTRTAGNILTITWNSVPGRRYRVEQAPAIGQWSNAATGLLATDVSTSYPWTIPAGWNAQGYLRVVLEP